MPPSLSRHYTGHVGHVYQIASSPLRGVRTSSRPAAGRSSAPLRFPQAAVPQAKEERPGLLGLWHLLSLDAPTVATLWTAFLAHANGFETPAGSLAAMFAAVWLLYAGDRLLDTRPGRVRMQELEARHRFHARHRLGFMAAIAVTVPLLACLLPGMSTASIHLYLIEGSFLVGYFLLVHAAENAPRLPKELAVGLFFSTAVFIPTVSHEPALRIRMLVPAGLLIALCSLNCLFIYRWEHRDGRVASPLTGVALRHLRGLSGFLFVGALAAAALGQPAVRSIAGAIAASVTLLMALDAVRGRLGATTLRATADLALLTPALFLFFP